MKVAADFVCDHGYSKPWSACWDCMQLGAAERPVPPAPAPLPEARKSGQMPETADDPIPKLTGDKDVSVPVREIDPHMDGPENDWLFGNNGFPWGLRPGGWVYLRHDGVLSGRARARSVGFRDVRPFHTGEPEDQGPGPTLEVDPSSWERVAIDLGDLADSQHQGYRYLITATDGTVTHLSATDPVPDWLDVDPQGPTT